MTPYKDPDKRRKVAREGMQKLRKKRREEAKQKECKKK